MGGVGVEDALRDQHTSAGASRRPGFSIHSTYAADGDLGWTRHGVTSALLCPTPNAHSATQAFEALRLLRPWRSDERLLREISGTRYSVGGDTQKRHCRQPEVWLSSLSSYRTPQYCMPRALPGTRRLARSLWISTRPRWQPVDRLTAVPAERAEQAAQRG